MMINEEVFAREFRALCSRFGRQNDPDLALRYYKAITNAGLTERQFVSASQALFATATKFPSPQDLIDAAPLMARPELQPAVSDDPHEPTRIYIKRGSGDHKAYEAFRHEMPWAEYRDYMDKHGYYWDQERGCWRYKRNNFALPVVEIID